MRILILTQWYWPEPSVKTHPFAQELAERGHEVTVVTGYPNYPGGKLHPGYRQQWRQWEEKDGVRILRVPLYPSHDQSSIRRLFNYISFAMSAALIGPLLCGPADVMWVYHPPLTVGIPSLFIHLFRRIPFVYEIQDMWPESLSSTGMISNGTILSILGRFAQSVYRYAAGITVISEGFRRNLIEKGVPAGKITVIPNWAEDLYQPVPRNAAVATAHGLKDRFNILFAGNMGPAQALDIVIDAAALLADLDQFQFVMIGDGLELPRLQERAAASGLENIRFIPRQAPQDMPEFYAWADGLLVHLRDDPLFRMTIPSKTLSYLASGKPILCGVAGDGADVVRQAEAGIVFQPEDAADLARAVRELYALSPQQREAIGKAARQAYESQFTRRKLIDQYETLFHQIIGR